MHMVDKGLHAHGGLGLHAARGWGLPIGLPTVGLATVGLATVLTADSKFPKGRRTP